MYLDRSDGSKRFRVESFRTHQKNSRGNLRCYFVYECHFTANDLFDTRLELISDRMFLVKATKNTKQIYQEIIELAVGRMGPLIEIFDIEGYQEKRVIIAFKSGTVKGIFSRLSHLYHYYGVTSSRKYVEQFSNGITVMSLYLQPEKSPEDGVVTSFEQTVDQITKDISLLYCVPQHKLRTLFDARKLSLQEAIYGHCVWIFIYHCLSRFGPDYASLMEDISSMNYTYGEVLSKSRMRSEALTSDYILEIIAKYPELVHQLYASFAGIHFPGPRSSERHVNIAAGVLSDSPLRKSIAQRVTNDAEKMIMEGFIVFNTAILKTNYYTLTKVALSFRLKPCFLPGIVYPKPLFGIFIVIGSEFRGFHLRFHDISKGDIVVIKSQNKEEYNFNARSLLDKSYGLASIQEQRNKDVPEGGANGIILLGAEQQQKTKEAFEKYIDAILDLLLPNNPQNPQHRLVDLYGKEEILFFLGPGSHDDSLANWATEHASRRGAPWWKAFFLGRSPSLGGTSPEIHYGTMPNFSMREYIKGIYGKLGLQPNVVKKLQVGGPDGLCGSSEILLSSELCTAIVDESGVLADPNGLDKQELIRLAEKFQMIGNFDTSKLSNDGYRVLCDEANITLPTGEVVTNGTTFRNTYHFRGNTDCLVICCGTPESIDLTTVSRLIRDGRSTIKYLIEGVPFITREARIRLESAGCIIITSPSATKGSSISTSLDILASLSFDDNGIFENMVADRRTGQRPQLYEGYIQAIQKRVCDDTRLEFEALWREKEQTGTPISVLVDTLSVAINTLNEELQKSELWHNEEIRRGVIAKALPKALLDQLGLDTIIQRVPEAFLRGVFGSYLASRFVYQHGSAPSQCQFREL